MYLLRRSNMMSLLRRSNMFIAYVATNFGAPLGARCDMSLLTERERILGLSYKHLAPTEQSK
jgi:hypothetical protein